MNTEEIFNLFLLISALHGFLFCFVILFSKNGREKSMLFINLLVLIISLNNMQSWILAKNFFIEYFFLDYIHIPWHFLIAPFFYMFLIHYLEIEKRSKNLLKIILPVFVLIITIRIGFVSFFSDKNTTDVAYLFEKYTSFEEIFSLIVSLIIFGYSFKILSKKEKLFIKILSYDNLKWIYTFFKLGLLTYIFWIIALAITVALDFKEFIYSYYPLRVLTTVLIYWIGYQALLQLRLLKERKDLRKQLNFAPITDANNIIKEEKDADKKIVFDKIQSTIQEKKLFIEPKLNAEFLANEVDISSTKLSTIIKLFTDKNFNDYINEFRIDLAKELLAHPEYKNYTITSIGLESGFNSKSTFYSTFKKHTGVTPAQYQKSLNR
ncbi:helix-turn-helix domain-containing protein [Polaribacter aestuariivivens]|uniref:Helix-turn-helix domain-containing protein n=1 Tax=Polaribacter aestuariivivens TaxID=2304626 RepID=A0A5S3N9T1_9FLAO|nr:helix-turn-helix domain-containing protein [Polaribacter aestuariivivens]TMM31985.1 helix-turn-helix domain-containing protein [Polaribacter aestuariivivens]